MTEPPLPATPFSSLQWRDSIIRSLLRLSSPGHSSAATLTEIDAEGATVFLTTLNKPVAFVAWPDDDPFGGVRVSQRLDTIKQALRPGMQVNLLISGGGASGQRLCEERAESRFGNGQILFHHLGDDGSLWNAGGAPPRPVLDALEDVRVSLARGEPLRTLNREELIAAQEEFRDVATSERAAFQILTSKNVPATKALLAVLVAVFLLELLWSGGGMGAAFSPTGWTLFRMGASDRAALMEGEWWRLITPAFLHGSLIHIAVNGWSLWVLGGLIERLLGSARFLFLYGISAIVAAMASTLFGEAMSVGASGAIFGLMGVEVALAFRHQGVLPANMAGRLRQGLWSQLLLNVMISTQRGIDWRAHLGGALAGFALMMSGLPTWGLQPIEVRATSGTRSRGWSVAALITALVMAAALGAGLGKGRPWESGVGQLSRVKLQGTSLSLQLPSNLRPTGDVHSAQKDEFSFGRLNRTEIFVEIVVEPAPDLVGLSQDQVGRRLLEYGQAIDQPELKLTEPNLEETAAGPVVSLEGTIRGWELSLFIVGRGDKRVILHVFSSEDTPADWAALGPKLAASLKDEGAPP